MNLGVYIHPFDLLPKPEPVLRELSALGVREIAVAAAYHAGRWTCARGDRIVRFLEDGVVHFRPPSARGEIVAIPSSLVAPAGSDPLECIIEAASSAGIEVHAWTVCLHNSTIGAAHAGETIENAFGDKLLYAMCPARPRPRAYLCDIAGALAGKRGLASIELEAAGYMGYQHNSHHEKSAFALGKLESELLAICFCEYCAAAMAERGADVKTTKSKIRDFLAGAIRDADVLGQARAAGARSVAEIETLMAPVREARARVVETLISQIRGEVAGRTRLAAMVDPNPRSAGAAAALAPASAARLLDGFVMTHYGQSAARRAEMWQQMAPAAGKIPGAAAFWPRRPDFSDVGELAQAARACAAGGARAARIYHYSLLPKKTLERAAAALAEI